MKNADDDITLLASDLRATFGMLKRRLRERVGVDDLTPSQINVLHWLNRHGPASVSRLARGCGLRPQSMSAIVAVLEAQGLVSGSPDPGDGRQTLISLTPLCRDKVAEVGDWLARQIKQLSSAERAHLAAAAAILRRISEHS